MVVYFALCLLPVLLPMIMFFCGRVSSSITSKNSSSQGKKGSKEDPSTQRSAPMPKSSIVVPSAPTTEASDASKMAEAPKEKTSAVEEKKEDTTQPAKSSDFKFTSLMMKEDNSQSIHTDLGSVKDDQNPLLDKTIQDKLTRTRSGISLHVQGGELSKIPYPPQQKSKGSGKNSKMLMPTQKSEATVKIDVVPEKQPSQKGEKPSSVLEKKKESTIEKNEKKPSSFRKRDSSIQTTENKPPSVQGESVMRPSHFFPVVSTQSAEKEQYCMEHKKQGEEQLQVEKTIYDGSVNLQ